VRSGAPVSLRMTSRLSMATPPTTLKVADRAIAQVFPATFA
jgi:hypothetical protein